MSAPKTSHPEIMYAERSSDSEPEKNIIYLTINCPDIQGEPKLDIEEKKITFSATSGNPDKGVPVKEWAFTLDLWGEIIPADTKKQITSRAIMLILRKKELRAEYWPRLTKEKPNRNWIKTDFSKWVDEDEQDPEEAAPEGDYSGMGGMPGMPPMGAGGPGGGMDFASMMGGMGGAGAGMPGGAGGAGGMDFAKMMAQMQGAGGLGDDEGGAGAPGGADFAKLMAQMQGGGLPEDDDDEAPGKKEKQPEPEVEEVE